MFTFDSIDTSGWAVSNTGKADAADRDVAKLVNSCWIAFYKLDPKSKSLTCAEGVTWPAYTEGNDQALQFKAKPQLVKASTIPAGPPRQSAGG